MPSLILSTTTTPPIGPMTRAHTQALQDEVTLLLNMCDLDTSINGLSPNTTSLCMLRCDRKNLEYATEKIEMKKGEETPTELGRVSSF